MKVISLWEPWASLMASGAKRIETRSWKTGHRGEMAIHAAKQPFNPADWSLELSRWLERVGLQRTGLRYGCILAVGELVDCVPTELIRDGLTDQECAFGDYQDGRYAWIFTNMRRLSMPKPMKGAQGIWNWNPDEVKFDTMLAAMDARLATQVEPPEPPPWEPVEPVGDQESGVDYAPNYVNQPKNDTADVVPDIHAFVDAFNVGAQGGAPLAPPTGKGEIPWMDGILIAWEVMTLLADLCTRISIGGSLRRSKPIVGDIEVIAQPSDPEAFERRCELLQKSQRFVLRLNKLGNRIAWSQRERCVVFKGMPLDLFIVQPDRQWGPVAVMRTGPNHANQALVTTRGRQSPDRIAGVLPKGMKFDDGRVVRIDEDGVIEPLDCPEERHVFAACGLPWVSPWLRTAAYYQWAMRETAGRAQVGQPMLGDDGQRRDWGSADSVAAARSPEGRWYRLEAAELLRRRPALAAEIEHLKAAGEVVKQGVLM